MLAPNAAASGLTLLPPQAQPPPPRPTPAAASGEGPDSNGGGGLAQATPVPVNPFFSFTTALALKHKKRSKLSRSLRTFWVLNPLSAASALLTLLLSLCTPDWLRTEEKMPNENRTVLFGPNKSPEYLPKLTQSGLFTLCCTEPGDLAYICTEIDYFPKEPYRPDQNDSTMAIPYAVLKSAWFFFVSGGLMIGAATLSAIGQCSKKKKILTFASGVTFIISGLLLFVGQVVYISILKGEIGPKLMPKSLLSPPRLTYKYGWSSLLLVASFLSCEVAGTSGIFLFIYHHQYRFVCRQPLKEELLQADSRNGGVRYNGDIIRHGKPSSEQQDKDDKKMGNGKVLTGHATQHKQQQQQQADSVSLTTKSNCQCAIHRQSMSPHVPASNGDFQQQQQPLHHHARPPLFPPAPSATTCSHHQSSFQCSKHQQQQKDNFSLHYGNGNASLHRRYGHRPPQVRPSMSLELPLGQMPRMPDDGIVRDDTCQTIHTSLSRVSHPDLVASPDNDDGSDRYEHYMRHHPNNFNGGQMGYFNGSEGMLAAPSYAHQCVHCGYTFQGGSSLPPPPPDMVVVHPHPSSSQTLPSSSSSSSLRSRNHHHSDPRLWPAHEGYPELDDTRV